jgi:hypothetical protein
MNLGSKERHRRFDCRFIPLNKQLAPGKKETGMKEKMAYDVFQEAFQNFFAGKKTTNDDGAPEGAAKDQGQEHEVYPGERK